MKLEQSRSLIVSFLCFHLIYIYLSSIDDKVIIGHRLHFSVKSPTNLEIYVNFLRVQTRTNKRTFFVNGQCDLICRYGQPICQTVISQTDGQGRRRISSVRNRHDHKRLLQRLLQRLLLQRLLLQRLLYYYYYHKRFIKKLLFRVLKIDRGRVVVEDVENRFSIFRLRIDPQIIQI